VTMFSAENQRIQRHNYRTEC